MYNLGAIAQKFNISLRQKSPIIASNASRYSLPSLFARLGYKSGAEVGTDTGYFSSFILRSNPKIKLYAIDTWEKDPTMQKNVKQRFAKYNVSLVKKAPSTAVKGFFPKTLDFVFIGSDREMEAQHLPETLDKWLRVIRPGGILAGHNYNKPAIKTALLAYTTKNQIKPWFVLHTPKLIDTWMIVKTG